MSTSSYRAPVVHTLAEIRSPAYANRRAIVARKDGQLLDFTGAQLSDAVAQTQRLLVQRAGLQTGDAIALSLVNGLEFVFGFLAVTNSRAIAAPLNPAYTQGEVDFYLKDMQCKALIVAKGAAPVARKAAKENRVPIYDLSYVLNAGRIVVSLDLAADQGEIPAAARALAASALNFAAPLPSPLEDDVAMILHTSGTTSKPKAVPLTHRNLCRTLTNVSATYRLEPTAVCMVVMPLFHVHGLMACLLSTLASGGCAVIPERFSAQTFWSEFASTGCTWYSAVPTIHQILLAREATTSSAPLRTRLTFIRSCSSALAPATWTALERTFGVPVVEAYAMTEASHQMTSNELPPGLRKSGSVGRGQGVEMAIFDDNGRQLPVGQQGEICVRGSNVTAGYLNNPEANANSYFAGRFFRTGDQGHMDADGFIFITGRLKELINRGGEKISPLEIDAVLLSHPAVGEAICFAKPDEKYGQEVVAAVVPKADVWARVQSDPAAQAALAKSIQAHATTKLAAFKVPKQVFFNDILPKTATGKIQRRNIATFFLAKEQKKSKL